MTPAGADFLYTVVLIAIMAILLWATASLVKLLVERIQADYYATTFGEDFLLDRDLHLDEDREAMQEARR